MFQIILDHQHSWQSVHQDAALPPLLSLLEALSRDYGQLIGCCVCAPRSGNVHISGSQERVESVTRAQFTQSDSVDSNPVCFGRRDALSGLAVIDPSVHHHYDHSSFHIHFSPC